MATTTDSITRQIVDNIACMLPANDYAQQVKAIALQNIEEKYQDEKFENLKVIYRCDLLSESKSFKEAPPDVQIHKAAMAWVNDYERRLEESNSFMESIAVSNENAIDEPHVVEISTITEKSG
jgi:hypothetical protein